MGETDYILNGRTEAVHETDACDRNDEGLPIDGAFVVFNADAVAGSRNKLNLRAAFLLSKPDVAHGGEFELSKNHLFAIGKAQCAGNGIDACRGIRHDGNFVRRSADEVGEL